MADKKEKPSKGKAPVPTTVDLAKESARAVTRKHGVPDKALAELKDPVKAAGVDPAVAEKLGKSYSDPHHQKPPKPKPPKKKAKKK